MATPRDESGELHDEDRRCWANVDLLGFHEGSDVFTGWSLFILVSKEIESWPWIALSPTVLGATGRPAVPPSGLAQGIRPVLAG